MGSGAPASRAGEGGQVLVQAGGGSSLRPEVAIQASRDDGKYQYERQCHREIPTKRLASVGVWNRLGFRTENAWLLGISCLQKPLLNVCGELTETFLTRRNGRVEPLW